MIGGETETAQETAGGETEAAGETAGGETEKKENADKFIGKGRERLRQDEEKYFEKMKAEMSENEKYLADPRAVEGKNLGFVQPYADSPMDNVHVGEDVYISMAVSAEKYAWFMTPYLIIDTELINALILAAKHGVDVRLMTPGIPDKKIVWDITRSYYRQLIKGGVKVYEYTPGFVHAKVFVSDDYTATVGTVNLDYRSLYLHFENGTYLYGSKKILDIKQDFLETLEQCHLMTVKEIRSNPFKELLLSVLRLFAPLM